jgi:hypothetical protein
MLIEPGEPRAGGGILREQDIVTPGHATRVWADDVNEDGKLDVLVGDMVTLVSPAAGLTEEDFNQKQAEWQQAFQAVAEEISKAENDEQREAARRRYIELLQKRSEFMQEEWTGFVWLYLQK